MSSITEPSDPTHYYGIYNALSSNLTLSSGMNGMNGDAKGALSMTYVNSLSSSNWQLYQQSGRYFIRNYDYGAGYQLGLTNESQSVPALLPRSGGLAQQWLLTQWPDNKTYRLTNALLGNSSMLTLEFGDTVTSDTTPVMDTNSTGAHWTFQLNPQAPAVTDPSLLSDVLPFETQTSSSATSTTTSTPATSTTTSTPATSATTSRPATSATTSTPNTSLSSGAIAGIAVGGVVVLLLAAVVLFVILRNRHQRKNVDSNLKPQFPTQTTYSAKQPYAPIYNQQVYEAPDSAPVELDGLDKRGK